MHVSSQSKVVCVASHTGLEADHCKNNVVNVSIFYPLDRLSTVVEVFSSNPQVCRFNKCLS